LAGLHDFPIACIATAAILGSMLIPCSWMGRASSALLPLVAIPATGLLLWNDVATAQLLPPGHRPLPPGVHAIKAAKVVPGPGQELTNAIVLLRDGRIEAVGAGLAIPADARVWELTNATVYAGFIDLHVPLSGGAVDSTSTQNVAADAHEDRDHTAGSINFFGVPGGERDPGAKGPGHELAVIRPETRVADGFAPATNELKALRGIGFTAANFVPDQGVLRGSSAFALLGDTSPNRALLRTDVFQHAALDASAAPNNTYPRSLMGVIAAVRQAFFDAQHYQQVLTASPPARDPLLGHSESLAALGRAVRQEQPVVFEPGSVLMVDRAARLAAELQLDFLMLASGHEWRRPDLVRATKARFIVPLNFPELPKFPVDADWEQVSLDQLRAWDWAAENPALLRSNQLEIALTMFTLKDRASFRKNLRLTLDRGLTETDALAALTTSPATWAGVGDQLGTIASGKLANLTVVEGSYFDPEAKLHSVWIEGRPYPLAELSSKVEPKKPAAKKPKEAPAARVAKSPLEGRGLPAAPPAVLFRNATIWTSGPEGILRGQDLLVTGGRIAGVGETGRVVLRSPDQLVEVDASGLHITPGLIDCHNHSFILGSVNEGTLPSTAMVRIGDVVNSEAAQMYQQLAGGLTTANLLHGSANPIGGQNAVVKLRWGAGPEELKLADAPPGIKFALGENVKQSNWGPDQRTRFPQTRMGVPVFMANRFTAAQHYLEAGRRHAAGQGPQPRRDLELEALGEIIGGRRLIHCHSYRQDEIVAFLRTMESFGVKVATLQHILEGYKVADEIAAHGAGASAFADWWAFKFEVIDAIPFAGAIMHERGVLVSFNSDSSDHARRLNREAAKAVKYGGVPEAEALKFVTLNPARQLRIDHRVGSLEPGKDADLAIWSGHPFAPETVCLQTWIDGRKYFDRALEPERVRELAAEREALLAKARKTADQKKDEPAAEGKKAEAARALFFREALEHSRQFDYSCCDAHATTLLQP